MLGNLLGRVVPEAFPGIHLPSTEPWPRKLLGLVDLNLPSNKALIDYVLGATSMDAAIEGQPKAPLETSLKPAQDYFLSKQEAMQETTGMDYPYFGSEPRSFVEMLTVMLKTNAFFASALRYRRGSFELVAYDPAEMQPNLYLKMCRTLRGTGHRVNFFFVAKNNDLKFKSFEYFDDIVGAKVKTDDAEKFASSALYNLLFYASGIHGTMHNLHYLMTSALDVSSVDFRDLQTMAEYYDDNVAVKYAEVALVLIADAPSTGESMDDLTIITGLGGFGSSQRVRPHLEDLLHGWGRCKDVGTFLDRTFSFSRKDAEKAGILTEFFKHIDLIPSFSSDVRTAFQSIDAEKLDRAETKLTTYLKNCGTFDGTECGKNLTSWLDIMAVTGIIHGGTLSFTRLATFGDILQWRNYHATHWDAGDLNIVKTGLGTVLGIDPDRHVMTSAVKKTIDPRLATVLDQYDDMATKLKRDYQTHITTHLDPTVFQRFAFILSDYCTDNFDGKQLTLATYI